MFGKINSKINIAYTNARRTRLRGTLFAVVLVSAYVIAFGLIAGPTNNADAAIPKYINFQGKLTKTSDGSNMANGTYAFEFKIYDDPSAGSLLWTETFDQPSGACGKLTVTNGVFNAKLGTCASLAGVDFTGGALYLTVNFAPTGTSYDGEMSPRKQLLSSAYAFVANGVSGDGTVNSTVSSATALTVAKAGSNYGFQVDTSAGSAATGLKVTSNAAASGLALSVISSGGNENLTVDAKGSGTISLGATSTGSILFAGGYGSSGVSISTSGAIQANGSITTDGSLTFNQTSPTVSIGNTGSLVFNDGTNTLCTVADGGTSGNLSCTNNISAGGVLQSGTTSTVAYSRLGTTTTGHSLNAADDLLIGDDLEVDGDAWVDGSLTITGSCTGCSVPTALDVLTASTTDDAALLNGDNTIEWDWALTSATSKGFTIGESSASTGGSGDQHLLKLITASGSTAGPLEIVSTSADSGDIEFNLASSGDFEIQDAGTPFVTFTDSGVVRIASSNSLGTTTSASLSVVANSISTGTGVYVASSSLSGGSLVDLAVTGTSAASNTQKVINVSTSGANSTSTQTTYGGFFSNTHTGTGSTNIGLYATASGGSANNYAARFDGNVLQNQTSSLMIKGSLNDATNLSTAQKVYVSGKYAYVASYGNNSLAIVDISNPASPVVIGNVSDATNLNGALAVKVSGKYAYLTSYAGARVTIVDISNPASPSVVGTVNDATNLNGPSDIVISGKYAYVSVYTGARVTILDISNPTSPTVVGNVNDATNLNGSQSLNVVGKYAYIASYSGNRLTVVDISNPTSPSVVGTVNDATNLNAPYGVYVSGKYAYVTAVSGNRLTVVDISSPTAPAVVGNVNDGTNLSSPRDVYVSGKYAYVAVNSGNRLTVVDISNPSSPSVTGNINDATNLNAPVGIYVAGKYAYVAVSTGARLTIVDIAGIDSPSANIGNLSSNDISVTENVDVGNNLYVRSGLNVGSGGIQGNGPLVMQGTMTGVVQSTTALNVSRDGSNYAFQVDTNTANSATGLKVTAAAAGGGLALAVISSGTDENLTVDAKGAGTVSIGATSTGNILLGGGSGSTGCTVTNSSGVFACTSNIATGGVLQAGSTSTVAYSRLGTTTTGHSLGAADDLLIGDDLEVDGDAWFDGNLTVTGTCTGCGGSSALDALTASTTDDAAILSGDNTIEWDWALTSAASKAFTIAESSASTGGSGNQHLLKISTASGSTAGPLEITSTSADSGDIEFNLASSGDFEIQDAGTPFVTFTDAGLLQVASSVSTGTTTSSSVSIVGNSLTSGTGLYLASSSLSSGSLIDVAVTGTAAASNTQKALNISTSGANATSTQTTYGGYFSNTHTGTGSTNIGLYSTATGGATNNYAAQFDGNVLQNQTSSMTVKGVVTDATNLNTPTSVYISGKYAYVAAYLGNRLTVVNVSNPASPTVVGNVNDSTNLDGPNSVYVSGKYAYVAVYTGNRLTVVDVSNPASPTVAGSLNDATNLSGAWSVYVSGKYAYVAARTGNRLTVVDVSNPASPTVVGNVNDATNLNLPLSVYVSGKYAYVAAYLGNRLTVVDVSNPASPTVVGNVNDATNLSGIRGVYVSGKYAYVAVRTSNRLTVVDVSNPASPTVVGNVNDATNLDFPISVHVSGKYAYVAAANGNRLTVVDVSNPASPTVVGNVNDATNLNGPSFIFISGKYAYITSSSGHTLTVVDITGIDAPTANIGNLSSNDITVTENVDIGNNLYVRNGLNVGDGGIMSGGPVTIQGSNTTQTTTSSLTALVGNSITTGTGLYVTTSALTSGNAIQVAGSGATMTTGGELIDLSLGANTVGAGLTITSTGTYTGTGAADGLINVTANSLTTGLGSQYSFTGLTTGSGMRITGSGSTMQAAGELVDLVLGANTVGAGLNITSTGAYTGAGLIQVTANTATTGTLQAISSSSLTTGKLLDLQVSGTAAGASQTALNIATTGANATSSITTYGAQIANTHSGTSSTNIGLYATATGGTTNNYAAQFDGNVLQNQTASMMVKGNVNDTTNINNPYAVYVSGKYAYIASFTGDRLTIVDISNPSSPVVTGNVNDTTNINDPTSVFVSGKYAYVTSYTGDRLTVVDVSNPTSPTVVGNVNDTTNINDPYAVYVSGKYAYVVAGTGNRLTVVDVSNPTSPTVVGNVNDATNLPTPSSVYVVGKYAYITAFNGNRLTVVDVSNPTSPTVVGNLNDNTNLNGAQAVYVSGKYAYVASYTGDRLTVVNISNPASMSVVGNVADGTNLNDPTSLYVSGKYAYVASYTGNRLTAVDISNPASPTVAGNINDGTNINNPRSVFVVGKYAYIAAYTGNRLTVVDITGIDAPTANIGNLQSNDITVTENVDIGNSLSVRSGINVGIGGILSSGQVSIQDANNPQLRLSNNVSGVYGDMQNTSNANFIMTGNTLSSSSAMQYGLQVAPVINQSSTAGFTGLDINMTETALGNSPTNFADFRITGSSKASIRDDGSFMLQGNGIINTPFGGYGHFENYLVRSEEFDNASWTKTNVSAPTADAQVGPDGASAAESLATSSSGGYVQQDTSTAISSTTYTMSVWARSTSGTQSFGMRIDGTSTGTGTEKTFTATTSWQRFYVTQAVGSFTGNVRVRIYPGTSGSTGTIYAWGAQLDNASVPSLYAKTTSAAITNIGSRGMTMNTNLTNSTASGFLYGERHIATINSGTAGTHDAVFIRAIDNTTLNSGQTVRGLEVQAFSGSNTNGTNTGIASFGYTFGIQATTTSQAAAQATPAAVFADLDNGSNATVGNAIRAYSDNATSADLVQLYTESAAYTGNALLLDIGNVGSGSGSFNSGNFISLKNAGSQKAHVNSAGNLFATLRSTATSAVCHITNGAQTDDELTDCSGSVSADYAEMYPVAQGVEDGELVAIGSKTVNTYDENNGNVDWNTVKGTIKELVKSSSKYQSTIMGVVSDNYGDFSSTGYNVKQEDNPKSIALAGRVPLKVSNENGTIEPGDFLTSSSTPGYAMKATKAGPVIGQALNSFSGGYGKIMVFVKATNYNGAAIEKEMAGIQFNFASNTAFASTASDVLDHLMDQLPQLSNGPLSEVHTDVVVANGAVITPNVVSHGLMVDSITSATANGGLQIASLTIFNGGLQVDSIKSIGDLLTFEGDVEFIGTPYFTRDTAGFAVIQSGVQTVDITFEREYLAQPIVNAAVSFEQDTDQEDLDEDEREALRDAAIIDAQTYLADGISYVVTNKSKYGFTVVLNKPATRDIKFSWTALAVRNANTFMSLESSGNVAGDSTPPSSDPPSDGGSGSGGDSGIGDGGDSGTPPPSDPPPSDPPPGDGGSPTP